MTEREFLIAHIERTAGPVATIWNEGEPLEFALVKASEERPFQLWTTLGMSQNPMNAPKDDWKWAELCVLLPPDWDFASEKWPLDWLQSLASLPFKNDSWLGYGHTIPNGDPPRPFAPETRLCGWLLLPPVSLPPEFSVLRVSREKVVRFWSLMAVHEDEMRIKLHKNTPALLGAFGREEVSEILDMARPSVYEGPPTVKRWIFG